MKKILDVIDIAIFAMVLGFTLWMVAAGVGTGRGTRDDSTERADSVTAKIKTAMAVDRYSEDKGAAA